MKNWQSISVKPSETLLNTMKIIDQSALQFAVVVDEESHLLGTVTDGDIRRSILRGDSLEVAIRKVMNPKPMIAKIGKKYSDYHQLMKKII